MSAADIIRYRLELYLMALAHANPVDSYEVAILQGRARAMRILLAIGVSD